MGPPVADARRLWSHRVMEVVAGCVVASISDVADKLFADNTRARARARARDRYLLLGTVARTGRCTVFAGGHNLLRHGPPGIAKTMLARRTAVDPRLPIKIGRTLQEADPTDPRGRLLHPSSFCAVGVLCPCYNRVCGRGQDGTGRDEKNQ